MNRRDLIDDVCLWCARLFVVFYLILLLVVGAFVVWPLHVHAGMYRTVDVWLALLALGSLWIFCLANLRHLAARWFLGVTAALYLALLISDLFDGIIYADAAQMALGALGFFGFPSMIWIALRPPCQAVRVSQT